MQYKHYASSSLVLVTPDPSLADVDYLLSLPRLPSDIVPFSLGLFALFLFYCFKSTFLYGLLVNTTADPRLVPFRLKDKFSLSFEIGKITDGKTKDTSCDLGEATPEVEGTAATSNLSLEDGAMQVGYCELIVPVVDGTI